MKKLSVMLVVAVVVALAGSAMAIDLPGSGSVKGAAKKAGRQAAGKAVVSGLNSKLEGYKCQYSASTKKVSDCRDSKGKSVEFTVIAGLLKSGRKQIEKEFKKDTDIMINGKNRTVCNNVTSQMNGRGWNWDYSCNQKNSLGNTVYFTFMQP